MDLCERQNKVISRHPWELARLQALRSLMKMIPFSKADLNVLDVGCGDIFTSRELLQDILVKSMTGIDTQLTDEQVSALSNSESDIIYCNDYQHLKMGFYNLVLLLDVIEHAEDDSSFLFDVVKKYTAAEAYILMTAPAHQFLFSSHDRFLKHYRRYNRKELLKLVESTKLECLGSGYLFLSLLWIRFFLLCYERLIPQHPTKNKGVGEWKRGKIVTKAIEFILRADNRIALILNQIGVNLPGLSVWVLCKKQR